MMMNDIVAPATATRSLRRARPLAWDANSTKTKRRTCRFVALLAFSGSAYAAPSTPPSTPPVPAFAHPVGGRPSVNSCGTRGSRHVLLSLRSSRNRRDEIPVLQQTRNMMPLFRQLRHMSSSRENEYSEGDSQPPRLPPPKRRRGRPKGSGQGSTPSETPSASGRGAQGGRGRGVGRPRPQATGTGRVRNRDDAGHASVDNDDVVASVDAESRRLDELARHRAVTSNTERPLLQMDRDLDERPAAGKGGGFEIVRDMGDDDRRAADEEDQIRIAEMVRATGLQGPGAITIGQDQLREIQRQKQPVIRNSTRPQSRRRLRPGIEEFNGDRSEELDSDELPVAEDGSDRTNGDLRIPGEDGNEDDDGELDGSGANVAAPWYGDEERLQELYGEMRADEDAEYLDDENRVPTAMELCANMDALIQGDTRGAQLDQAVAGLAAGGGGEDIEDSHTVQAEKSEQALRNTDLRHVMVVIGKHLVRDQVTVEYASRIRRLVQGIQSGRLRPDLVCFTGGRVRDNKVADASAGYIFFRHLCEHHNVDTFDIGFLVENESTCTKEAMRNVVKEIVRLEAEERQAMEDENRRPRVWPRQKYHFTLISNEYHLTRVCTVHKLSETVSLLSPLRQLQASWGYEHVAYPYACCNDEGKKFQADVYRTLEELVPLQVNVQAVASREEFFQEQNYQSLGHVRQRLAEFIRRLHSSRVPLELHMHKVDLQRAAEQGRRGKMGTFPAGRVANMRLDEALEWAAGALGKIEEIIEPAATRRDSVSLRAWAMCAALVEKAILQGQMASDPDRPLSVNEWGVLEDEQPPRNPADDVPIPDLTPDSVKAMFDTPEERVDPHNGGARSHGEADVMYGKEVEAGMELPGRDADDEEDEWVSGQNDWTGQQNWIAVEGADENEEVALADLFDEEGNLKLPTSAAPSGGSGSDGGRRGGGDRGVVGVLSSVSFGIEHTDEEGPTLENADRKESDDNTRHKEVKSEIPGMLEGKSSLPTAPRRRSQPPSQPVPVATKVVKARAVGRPKVNGARSKPRAKPARALEEQAAPAAPAKRGRGRPRSTVVPQAVASREDEPGDG